MSIISKKKKILFLPKWYPNYLDMSDGLFIEDHAKAVGIKNDVFLLFIHSSDQIEGKRAVEFDDTKGFKELKIYFKSVKTGIGFLDKLFTGLRYLSVQFAGYQRVKEVWGEPDICHVHVLLRTSFLARRLKRKKNIPYVISEHWSGYDPAVGSPITGFKRKQLQKSLRKSSGVTAVSDYLMEHLKQIYKHDNTQVIANAINEEIFTYKEKQTKEIKRFLHISTLSSDPKNFDLILKTMAELTQKRSDFVLDVVGEGVEMDEQIALAKELGVYGETVLFHGYLEKEDVATKFHQSDLFVLFSRNETQSCVLLESFLTGTPAIVPNVGGAKELIADYNGKLVERNDSKQLLQLLNSFLNDEFTFDHKRMSDEALQFGYKNIGNQFDSLYNDILS